MNVVHYDPKLCKQNLPGGDMQVQPGRDDVHLEDPQYALHGALTSCAETLERLTEVSLSLEPETSKIVRRRLQEAVGKCSESFRLTVAAWDAWVRSKDTSQLYMRSQSDYAEALRSSAGRPSVLEADPDAPTRDLHTDDPNENGGT